MYVSVCVCLCVCGVCVVCVSSFFLINFYGIFVSIEKKWKSLHLSEWWIFLAKVWKEYQ